MARQPKGRTTKAVAPVATVATKRCALYLRVSRNEQTTMNQRLELEAVAQRHGWAVTAVYEDAGISGAKGKDKRPGLAALHKAAMRREIDMVVAWSVDRLGRSLVDLLNLIEDLKSKDVGLYLHQQGLDTSSPSGKAFLQMTGVFAEFERSMIRERVKAGLSRAKAEGKTLGRPKSDASTEAAIRALRAEGKGKQKIAKELGIGVSTVMRVLAE